MKNVELLKNFINGSKNFWEDHLLVSLDNKHKNILKKFNEKYKDNVDLLIREIVDWDGQTDNNAPFQFSFHNFKYKNIFNILRKLKNFFLQKYFDKESFLIDYEIIKSMGGDKILEKNPVHKRPFSNSIYFFNKNVSANQRWLRYIYLATQIINKKLLKDNDIWIDIGSYYGGLQYIVRGMKPNVNCILLDFHHQLSRSYVLLKNRFPDSDHFLPNQVEEKINSIKNNKSSINGSFFYVPVTEKFFLDNLNIDLVTNFFSFGEMKKEFFLEYYNSQYIKNSNYIYLVNRFVSSPFFEKTFDSDLNIFDYLNETHEKIYFDIFPIHHYENIKRPLYNINSRKPVSSSYFEMIKKNIKIIN